MSRFFKNCLKFIIPCFLTDMLLPQVWALSQRTDRTDPKIVRIEIQGNRKTKDYIILREMKLKVGDRAHSAQIEEDRRRIQNLGLFARAEMDTTRAEDGITLVVRVTERWYIFPFPVFFINERDWGKLSYGAGVIHTNFRGRNELLFTDFWLGYNSGVELNYSNRWFGGEKMLFTQINLFKKRVKNKNLELEDFDENHIGINWSIGKRFGYYTYLSLKLGYEELSVTSSEPRKTLSPSGVDRLPSFGINFQFDNRDLWEYPHSGWNTKIWAKQTGLRSKWVNYWRYGFDLRRYLPLTEGLTLAVRGAMNLARGEIPVYDRVFLGYNERVRGHFDQKYEGENLAIGGIALRFPLRGITYHNLESEPLLGGYGRNLKFGISAGVFVDTGAVWFKREKLSLKKLTTGYGLGLHFHLPYINLLRVEYAFDEDFNGEAIVDAEVAF